LDLHVVPLHEAGELHWDLVKHLSSKVSSLDCLVEWHELDNITLHLSAVLIAELAWTVTIKLSHGSEVSIANTDDDHRAWKG
jgi:hypothetical protein